MRIHIADYCCINLISFWPVSGLSHHNASPGDGNQWVTVPCWSYGGTIHITSKRAPLTMSVNLLPNITIKHRDVPEVNRTGGGIRSRWFSGFLFQTHLFFIWYLYRVLGQSLQMWTWITFPELTCYCLFAAFWKLLDSWVAFSGCCWVPQAFATRGPLSNS